MKITHTLCIAIFTALIFGASFSANAAVIAESDFEIDADGWTGWFCANPGLCVLNRFPLLGKFAHNATGGNPGGWISAEDPDSENAARFFAPDKFEDNLNITTSNVVSNQRILTFDAIVKDIDGTGVFDSPTAPIVAVEASDRALVYWAPVPAEEVWTGFTVPLFSQASDAGLNVGWDLFTLAGQADATEADFLAFGTVLRLSIIGEWLNDDADVDIGGLDNVRLSAVPVPAALPLLLSALIAGGLFGRRRG